MSRNSPFGVKSFANVYCRERQKRTEGRHKTYLTCILYYTWVSFCQVLFYFAYCLRDRHSLQIPSALESEADQKAPE